MSVFPAWANSAVKRILRATSVFSGRAKSAGGNLVEQDGLVRDIFLCYRRADSAEVVDRIYERLEIAYPGRIFRDVNQMQGGLDFRDQIALQLRECQVALVVIGPIWATATGADGRNRLASEDDQVRIEVESVLAREALRVFPLLVRGATLPEPDAVPQSMRSLLRRHGYPIRRDPDFKSDIEQLITALDVSLGVVRLKKRNRRLLFFFAGFLVASILFFTFHERAYRIAAEGHDFIRRKDAEVRNRPLIANRAALDRWKGNIFALQAPNGGISFKPGSEPQVWTTAQALTALLASPLDLKEDHERIIKAFEFIEQSRDETADGWGLFEDHTVAHTEIAAWVCVANAQLFLATRKKLFADHLPEARTRIQRDLASMQHCRLPSPKGAYSPILVGTMVPELARTYSTIMALWAMAEARDISDVHEQIGAEYDQAMDDTVAWLFSTFRPSIGWLASPNAALEDTPLPGLTAQAIYVLRRVERVRPNVRSIGKGAIAKQTFVEMANPTETFDARDLMGGDVTNLRPTKYKLENSAFVRFPWLLLATSSLRNDESLFDDQREKAAKTFERLKYRSGGLDTHLRTAEVWEIAETLFCVSIALEQERGADW